MLGNPRQSWILVSTPWIPDSRYWIPDFLSCIPDSKAEDFVFNRQKFTGFRNSDSFKWGEFFSVLNNRQHKISEPVYAKGRQEEEDGKTFVRDKRDRAITCRACRVLS